MYGIPNALALIKSFVTAGSGDRHIYGYVSIQVDDRVSTLPINNLTDDDIYLPTDYFMRDLHESDYIIGISLHNTSEDHTIHMEILCSLH